MPVSVVLDPGYTLESLGERLKNTGVGAPSLVSLISSLQNGARGSIFCVSM